MIKAIREDEDAVRSFGKSVYAYKLQALTIGGGVMGCFGGFVAAIAFQSIQPDYYSTDLTFFAYAVLILGGAARVLGPIVGSVVFWFRAGAHRRHPVERCFQRDDRLHPQRPGGPDPLLDPRHKVSCFDDLPTTGGILGDKKELSLDAR